MAIRVCIAGVSGWTGSAVARAVIASKEFELTAAISRKQADRDVGEFLGGSKIGVAIASDFKTAFKKQFDVLIDYTSPSSVKQRALEALANNIRVVIGTSGLTAADFLEIEQAATTMRLGVIAAGNFSITAALAKHFALLAANYIPSWEVIDYAKDSKVDAPSGSARELAEALGSQAPSKLGVPIDQILGSKEARGAAIGGTQVHSIRLPGFVLAFETILGLPHERLTIRHDAGASPEPYVNGTLLAVRRVMETVGLIRGLDQLLFQEH